MKKNIYYIKARLLPSIICSIPILSTYFYGFDTSLKNFIYFLQEFKWIGDVTISVALIFLLVQINRFIAKELFQRLFFNDEIKMPTTNYLLHSNTSLSTEVKKNIHDKIDDDFNIKLSSISFEKANELEARKIIITAVSQIRNSTRDNALLLQHNIEYGFMRNLIGGAVLAILVSFFNIYYFNQIVTNEFAFKLNIVMAILFSIPILSSKFVIKRYGHYYAKVLFEQYLKK